MLKKTKNPFKIIRASGSWTQFLRNISIYQNTANWNGGGVFLRNSNPLLENVIISNNIAHSKGGGIYFYFDSELSEQSSGVLISDNYSEGHGGGIFISTNSNNI